MSHKFYKNHDDWNKLKKILEEVDIHIPFNEREIWWCSFGSNIGIEIEGKGEDFERPAIIIKKFNIEHAIVVPLTHFGIYNSIYYVPIYYDVLAYNSFAVITQIQRISSKRLMRRIGILSLKQFVEIIDAIKNILPDTKKL
jgi:mRNA interferase MazF